MLKPCPAMCAALSFMTLAVGLQGCDRRPYRSHEGGTWHYDDKHFQYASIIDDGDAKLVVFHVWKAPKDLAEQEAARCWEEVKRTKIVGGLRVLLCLEGGETVELDLSAKQSEDLRAFVGRKIKHDEVLERVVRPAALAKGIALAW